MRVCVCVKMSATSVATPITLSDMRIGKSWVCLYDFFYFKNVFNDASLRCITEVQAENENTKQSSGLRICILE